MLFFTRGWLVGATSLLLFAALLTLLPFPANFEDSYITYRYIDALTKQGNFNWNYDYSPVYGMTGLLFPVLAAILNIILTDAILASSLLGISCVALAIIVLALNATRTPESILAIFLFAINPIVVIGSTNGLETSLALLYVTIIFVYKDRISTPLKAAAVTAAAFVIRPDLIIIPAAVFVIVFWNRGIFETFRFSLFAGILLTAILTLTTWNFGKPLPNAVEIKIAAFALVSYPRWVLSQHVILPSFACAPTILLALVSLASTHQTAIKKTLLTLAPLILFGLYLLTTLPIMNHGLRFFAPIFPGMTALLATGELRVSEELREKFRDMIAKIAFASAFVIAATLSLQQYLFWSGTMIAGRKHYASIVAVGQKLAPINDIRIASPEAGQLAWHARPNRFFDTLGLNDNFVSANSRKDGYPAILLSQLKQTGGLPDVYVRFAAGIQAGPNSYLEILPDFEKLYECRTVVELRVCINASSSHANSIAKALQFLF